MKKKRREEKPYVKKDTLVIIGNGFDCWQKLDTSYSSFRKYYLERRDEIMKRLHIKPIEVIEDGKSVYLSDVELIYGDPFDPGELDADFWNLFEMSLDDIDTEGLNALFGKEKSELKALRRSIKNAKRILQEAFGSWVSSIEVDERAATHHFGENCVFINFNYTDTLEKRFGVAPLDVYHIHGEASDRKSIIFGHSSHPQLPEPMLYKLGGRFRGLYLAQELLYETDKHIDDNIQLLIMYFAARGIMCEDIKNIYVLGHSMSPVDIEYFIFLYNATRRITEDESLDSPDEEDAEGDYLNELHARMEYIVNTVGYGKEDSAEGRAAIERQYRREQEARNEIYEKDFMRAMGIRRSKGGTPATAPIKRQEDALWHISCHSERDRVWVDKLMEEFGTKNYRTYKTIDECIEEMGK